jgi:hypothetical protein
MPLLTSIVLGRVAGLIGSEAVNESSRTLTQRVA